MNDNNIIKLLNNINKDNIDSPLYTQQESLLISEFALYHIEELTFEDKSPRKEAFENVLSSIRSEGITFIYLILGNQDGVSFYFGITKDKNYKNSLELNVDNIGKFILKPSIEGNFRGSKVKRLTQSKRSDIQTKIKSFKKFAKITGVPSVNEEKEEFQGIDRLVDVMSGDDFGLMILADPLSKDEIIDIEDSLYDMYNKLSPLSKKNYQIGRNESETKSSGSATSNSKADSENSGKSEAISNGTSNGKSWGTNQGKSEAISNGSSDNDSKNTSYTNTDSKNKSSSSNGGGESSSKGKSYSKSETTSSGSNDGHNKGTNHNKTNTTNSGTSISYTTGTSTNEGISIQSGDSQSTTYEYSDKKLQEWMSYIDDILLKMVKNGKNRGLYHSNIYLLGDKKEILTKLGNTIQSLFAGVEDNKAPLELEYIDNEYEIKSLKNFQFALYENKKIGSEKLKNYLLSKSVSTTANWLSTNELGVIASLPQKEVLGLALREEVEFGLNFDRVKIEENILKLGNLVKSGNKTNISVSIDKNQLNKHIFIAGVTGSGKTTTCQRILDSANIPFMVIEPAKTEYRILTKENRDILIFTLGNDRVAPFRLNPFEFLPHENITARVDMIKASIEASFDMEAAIPQLIESAIYKCYEDYGWNINTSKNTKYNDPFEDGVYAFPILQDLIDKIQKVVKMQGFDERLENDYIGSIKARLQGLILGSKGLMLNTHRSIDFTKLVNQKIILELEEIKNPSQKSLIMGFILINLNEAIKANYNKNRNFKHITLIEEAHRLLSKYEAGDSLNKKQGVEMFSDMLAEVRKYGESLIIVDQIPNKLTSEVLKNTNTKIIHKLFAKDDKEAVGNTMALNDEQKEFLSNLDIGRVILSSGNISKPIQVQIEELVSTTNADIVEADEIRKIILKYYYQNYKRGLIKGLELYDKEPTLDMIEDFLENRLNNIWQLIIKRKEYDVGILVDKVREYLIEYKIDFIHKFIGGNFYNNQDKEKQRKYLYYFLGRILNDKNDYYSNEDNDNLRIGD